jgi:23S rRNA (uridine2552-2'-O)-methyltransferase
MGGKRRGPAGGRRQLKVRLRTAAWRSASSQRWLARQLNDPYVAAARHEGLRSRAAFKLREIDDQFALLKPGRRVIDLGAAPGGWSQVAAERVNARGGAGQVIGIDLQGIAPLAGVEFLRLDVCDATAVARLGALLRGGQADVVLSDMAPQATGHGPTDHLRIIALAEAAADFAASILAPGGAFLCKVFQGGTERTLIEELRRAFTSVKHSKPPSSRARSTELYVVAQGFRGRQDLPRSGNAGQRP